MRKHVIKRGVTYLHAPRGGLRRSTWVESIQDARVFSSKSIAIQFRNHHFRTDASTYEVVPIRIVEDTV